MSILIYVVIKIKFHNVIDMIFIDTYANVS